jgi:hypothetical protein
MHRDRLTQQTPQDEIVDVTGYAADLVLRICTDAGYRGD